MSLIGTTEAAKRAGVANAVTILRSLRNAGVPLVRIGGNALAVEETDLEQYLKERGGELKPGRPKKEKSNAA